MKITVGWPPSCLPRSLKMFDCSKDVRAFHNTQVTLPKITQDDMRDYRDKNRKRVRNGLKSASKPAPTEFVKQGSYAMKTMVWNAELDYDIDDGVYFKQDDLVGPQGGQMTPRQARDMVRDAVDDNSFKTAPEVRTNCVRVYYDQGFHVDLPVYRKVIVKNIFGDDEAQYELASGSTWKRSDARDVNDWYEDKRRLSADGTQMRRVNRELKKFAKSRVSWGNSTLSGFAISVLTTEKFVAYSNREDEALYFTMERIRDRLNWDLEVKHPVTPDSWLTNGSNDAKSKFFREKLVNAVADLRPLFEPDCTREKALKCWDKVFNTTFFSDRYQEEASVAAALAAPPIFGASTVAANAHTSLATKSLAADEKLRRATSAAEDIRSSGRGTSPWACTKMS